MDLIKLRQMGLVTSNPLVKREITIKFYPTTPEETWAVPTVPEREAEKVEGHLEFWLKKFTAADRIALSTAQSDEDRAYIAIQRTVFTENGEHVFPDLDTARELDLDMFGPLLNAINQLNHVTEKKSKPRTNGGVSLPSPSAVAPSPNGKTASRKRNSRSGRSTDLSGDR